LIGYRITRLEQSTLRITVSVFFLDEESVQMKIEPTFGSAEGGAERDAVSVADEPSEKSALATVVGDRFSTLLPFLEAGRRCRQGAETVALARVPVFIIVVLLPTHACMGYDLIHRSAFGDYHVHLDGSAMVGGNRIRCLPRACCNPGEFPVSVSLPEDCSQGYC